MKGNTIEEFIESLYINCEKRFLAFFTVLC